MELPHSRSNPSRNNAFWPSSCNAILICNSLRKMEESLQLPTWRVRRGKFQIMRPKRMVAMVPLRNKMEMAPCEKWRVERQPPNQQAWRRCRTSSLWRRKMKWRWTNWCALKKSKWMKWAKRISYRRPKGCCCSSSASLRRKNSKSRHSGRRWSRPAAPNSMKAEDLLKWARDQTNTDMMTEPQAPRDLQKKGNRPILSWKECHQSQPLRNWNSRSKRAEPRRGSNLSRIVRPEILKVRNQLWGYPRRFRQRIGISHISSHQRDLLRIYRRWNSCRAGSTRRTNRGPRSRCRVCLPPNTWRPHNSLSKSAVWLSLTSATIWSRWTSKSWRGTCQQRIRKIAQCNWIKPTIWNWIRISKRP